MAKSHKLTERLENPNRLNDEDAHDVYRILQAVDTTDLVRTFRTLLRDPVSEAVTAAAIEHLRLHLAPGPHSPFAVMAGRAETGLGYPDTVALSASILAHDLLTALDQ